MHSAVFLQAEGCGASFLPYHCLQCGEHWRKCMCTPCGKDSEPCACLPPVPTASHWDRKVCPSHFNGQICKLMGKDAQFCHGVRPGASPSLGLARHTICLHR